MSKRYIKYSVVCLGFILAVSYNACMVDGGALDNKKDLGSGGEDIKENSGVGGWSTYPGGSTVHNTAGTTGGTTGTTAGTTAGATGGSTAGSTGGASGGGNTGISGGSGNCSSGQATTPISGTGTPMTCESNEADWERLENWLEESQSSGIPYCGVYKHCKNCCGSESRYDMFYGSCTCPQQMDPATLGATSESRCEDTNENRAYIAGFMEAKRSVDIPCTTVKDCMNCCGPANNLDKFHVSCER